MPQTLSERTVGQALSSLHLNVNIKQRSDLSVLRSHAIKQTNVTDSSKQTNIKGRINREETVSNVLMY